MMANDTATGPAPPSYGSIANDGSLRPPIAPRQGSSEEAVEGSGSVISERSRRRRRREVVDSDEEDAEMTDEESFLLGSRKRRRKKEWRKQLCRSALRGIALLILIVFVVDEAISALNPDRNRSAPAPYLSDPKARLVEQYNWESPQDVSRSDDPRIPRGSYWIKKEVNLEGDLPALLLHTVGMRYTGRLHVQGGLSSSGARRAAINVTAFASAHATLDNSLTLARVESGQGLHGLTLASDIKPWYDPANNIEVLIDIAIPDAPSNYTIDLASETLELQLSDLGDLTSPSKDIMREISLHTRGARIETGVSREVHSGECPSDIVLSCPQSLAATHAIRIHTGQELTALGTYYAINGTVDISGTRGITNLGGVISRTINVDITSGAIIAQFLQAQDIQINTESAIVEAAVVPEDNVRAQSRTGGLSLKVILTNVRHAANVSVVNILGEVDVRYQFQRADKPLFSSIQSRLGKVYVEHARNFQGEVDLQQLTNGLITVSADSKERDLASRDEPGLYRIFGRIWNKGHDPYGKGESGWGRSEVKTFSAPIYFVATAGP